MGCSKGVSAALSRVRERAQLGRRTWCFWPNCSPFLSSRTHFALNCCVFCTNRNAFVCHEKQSLSWVFAPPSFPVFLPFPSIFGFSDFGKLRCFWRFAKSLRKIKERGEKRKEHFSFLSPFSQEILHVSDELCVSALPVHGFNSRN